MVKHMKIYQNFNHLHLLTKPTIIIKWITIALTYQNKITKKRKTNNKNHKI